MKKYNVSDINSGFHGEIHEIADNKFVVKANSVISTKFNDMENQDERKSLVMKLETEGNLSDCAQTRKDVEFTSLAEAAKAICLDDNWERHISEITDYETAVDSKEESSKNKETTESENVEGIETVENNNIYKDIVKLVKDIFSMLYKSNKKDKNPNTMVVKLDDESKASIESVTKAVNDLVEFNKEREKSLINPSYKWNSKPNNSKEIGLIGYDISIIDKSLDNPKKAVIIEGVPGTGKTKLMIDYAKERSETLDDGTKTFKNITFHKNFQYIDFIGGQTFENGKFIYIDGVFTEFCKLADQHPDKRFYFLIDELSRGDVSNIFGELITAICTRGEEITLSTGRTLVIPDNLYIIASMNTEDVNTTDIDLAIYQRFQHLVIEPKWTDEYIEILLKTANETEVNQLNNYLEKLFADMRDLNDKIKYDESLGDRYLIGTRDITIEHMTVEKLKNAVNNSLLVTINRVIKSSYNYRSMSKIVDNIRETFR